MPDECFGSGVVLNEFNFYYPSDYDGNGDGETGDFNDEEYLEILNTTGADIDISNWSVSDRTGVRHVFDAGTIISANCGVVVNSWRYASAHSAAWKSWSQHRRLVLQQHR